MFKTNFRLVEDDNNTQITPFYKAKTFICKNMSNILWTIKAKPYVALILSRTVYVYWKTSRCTSTDG
jgi:hypothetical protein